MEDTQGSLLEQQSTSKQYSAMVLATAFTLFATLTMSACAERFPKELPSLINPVVPYEIGGDMVFQFGPTFNIYGWLVTELQASRCHRSSLRSEDRIPRRQLPAARPYGRATKLHKAIGSHPATGKLTEWFGVPLLVSRSSLRRELSIQC